jgi:hypothetical protein
MSEQRKIHTHDDIRALIEQVDDQLRRAEVLRTYVNDRNRRRDFFPERRRSNRIPQALSDEGTPDTP